MKYFLLGFYLAGAIATFCVSLFLVLLGGRSEDLWIPPIYALFWPIAIPIEIWRFLSGH